jgi:hypothetical protein
MNHDLYIMKWSIFWHFFFKKKQAPEICPLFRTTWSFDLAWRLVHLFVNLDHLMVHNLCLNRCYFSGTRKIANPIFWNRMFTRAVPLDVWGCEYTLQDCRRWVNSAAWRTPKMFKLLNIIDCVVFAHASFVLRRVYVCRTDDLENKTALMASCKDAMTAWAWLPSFALTKSTGFVGSFVLTNLRNPVIHVHDPCNACFATPLHFLASRPAPRPLYSYIANPSSPASPHQVNSSLCLTSSELNNLPRILHFVHL